MENKVALSSLHALLHDIFTPRKENKRPYISILKTSIYLFKHFYFFRFNAAQFTDFASLKI